VSTDEEIAEVYLTDIADKTNQVRNRRGILPFLVGDGTKSDNIEKSNVGLTVFSLLDPEITEELRAIWENDKEWQKESRIDEKRLAFLQKIGWFDKEDK